MSEIKLEPAPTVRPVYPSNANMREQNQTPEEPRVDKAVAKGKVVQKKPNRFRKMFETFVGQDLADMKDYLLRDVMIPTLKRGLFDILAAALGVGAVGAVSKGIGRPNYRSYYDDPASGRRGRAGSTGRAPSRGFTFDPVYMDSRMDAQEILDQLQHLINQYGNASVADLYSLAEISAPFTYRDWGWYDLIGAKVLSTRDGWLIDLPRPLFIK